MLLRSIKSLDFGSITLEVSRKQEDPSAFKRMAVVNSSFIQAVSKVSEMNQELEGLRIRIVASYTKKSSQLIDFTTQRFNEYLIFEDQDMMFRANTPASEYVSFLRNDLGAGDSVLSETQPFSPYSTNKTAIPEMFRNLFSDQGTLEGTVVYDAALTSALPRDEDGNILRRSIVDTNVAVMAQRPEAQLADENRDWSEVFIDLVSQASTQNTERVHMDPVVFDMSGLTEGDLDQLTFYMFIYESDFGVGGQDFTLPQISLVTGMTLSRTANVIGERTAWPRITAANPYRGIGLQQPDGQYIDTVVVESPDAEFFQRIDLNPQQANVQKISNMFDQVYGTLARTILDDKPEIKKIVKKDNFFSDLWMTKDSEENNRFMFAFDIESCLIANSYFPFLYRSPNISNQLINKQGLMNNENSEPSRVLMMNVKRRFVDKDTDIPINEIGTSGGRKEKGPNSTFKEKIIGEATPSRNIYLNPDNTRSVENKTIFYEGRDSLTDPTKYLPGKYEVVNNDLVYGTEYIVYDAAPIFMRNMIKFLTEQKTIVREIFDTIVNSVPTSQGYRGGIVKDGRDLYDPVTRTLNVSLKNISGTFDGQIQLFENVLLKAAGEYQQILDDLIPFEFEGGSINVYQFFRDEFRRNGGLIDPLTIKDLEKLMDVGIQLIFRKLTEIFPNDPMGRGLGVDIQSNLERRGFCQRKMPLVRGEYYFDADMPKGEDFGFGSDFIFDAEPDMEGLARISLADYVTRINLEFEKYFQSDDAGSGPEPVASFIDPSHTYFTSLVIRTPGRNEIVQTQAGGNRSPVVRYDLNRYGQLFADICNLKYFAKNRKTNPEVEDRSLAQSQNNILYDSIITALEEQHRVEITTDIQTQYNPPKIMTGDVLPTVGDNFFRRSTYIFRNGPLAIPTLIGGENNLDPNVITFLDSVDSTISQNAPQNSKGLIDKNFDKLRQVKRPIKLPFAILGELTVDPELKFDVDYEDKAFNSLKKFSNTTIITQESLRPVLQDTFVSGLPNQVKSAIIVAVTNQRLVFGNDVTTFDACRPVLEDKDSGEEERLISFSESSDLEPPYALTYDPMKTYAKFLTFWMNYKQIATVEYLDSFGDLEKNEDFYKDILQLDQADEVVFDKAKLPSWRRLTQARLADASKAQKNLLCRVRLMTPEDYVRILSEYKPPILDMVREFFERKEMLELPIYNRYFLLGMGETPEEQEPAEQESFMSLVGPGYRGPL